MLSDTLIRQRIKYLIEFGGLYPAEEPASKNFVCKVAAFFAFVQLAETVIEVFILRR